MTVTLLRHFRLFDLVAVAVVLGTSAGGFFLAVGPALRTSEVAAAAQSEASRAHERAAASKLALAAAKTQLANMLRVNQINTLRLLSSAGINDRLAKLNTSATLAGLTLLEVQPRAEVSGTHYNTVPIYLSGTGNYAACEQFLHGIASDYPDIAVTGVNVWSNPTQAGADVSFKLTLAWYTLPAATADAR